MSEMLEVQIPKDVENLYLPNPELLTYYELIEDRVLWLDSQVDQYWLEFEKLILKWNKEDKNIPIEQRKPIKLMFFSYGGSLDINHAFIDLIQKSKTPIWGVNMGQACSAACYIFIACHKRFTMPRSTFLIHQGGVENGFSGTYEQVMSAIMEYQRKVEELKVYLLETTKMSEDLVDENFDTEWYLSADEAVELGVADEIIEDLDSIL